MTRRIIAALALALSVAPAHAFDQFPRYQSWLDALYTGCRFVPDLDSVVAIDTQYSADVTAGTAAVCAAAQVAIDKRIDPENLMVGIMLNGSYVWIYGKFE